MARALGAGVIVGLLAAVVVSAHHSIAAVYDSKQSVTIDAVLVEFHFVNPHPYLIASGAEPGGATEAWHLELDNRAELVAVGVTATTLKPGDRVRVTGSRSRTEAKNLYVRTLVRGADGFEYAQVGSSPRIKTR
jgi:hypothetical protein